LKEALGGELGVTERRESQRLGAAVFEVMRVVVHELVGAGVSVIAEGNFTDRTAVFDDLPQVELVQVYVTAAPETLRERLRNREGRHPVHYDAEAADEIEERARAGGWPPLSLGGRLLEVDTTVWPDLDAALASVAP
jgi:predicted kinase